MENSCKMCNVSCGKFTHCYLCNHGEFLGYPLVKRGDKCGCGKCRKILKNDKYPLCYKCNEEEKETPSKKNVKQKEPKKPENNYLFD